MKDSDLKLICELAEEGVEHRDYLTGKENKHERFVLERLKEVANVVELMREAA